jgi:hypothetical protein
MSYRVSHLEIAHDVWLKLCNIYDVSSKIKSSRKDIYNRQYQTLSQKPGESLVNCFARFDSIVSCLRSYVPLVYSDNECVKQLIYALDDFVWDITITALEEFVDFAIIDTEKLFSKLKSHELSRKGRPNHDVSLTSMTLITSARVGGHDTNPTNTTGSSALEFVLSCLAIASDKQYESIPYDEVVLLVRKLHTLHKFHEERRSPRVASSVATPPTSSPTIPRGRSLTPPTSMTISSGTTIVRAMIRRNTSSRTRRRKRSYRRSCPKCVLPLATSTSPVMTHPTQTRMRMSSTSNATSPTFSSWASLREISSALILM